MNKKYIVKTQGTVLNFQDKAYEVVARDKNEAEVIAKNMFAEEYAVADEQLKAAASGITFANILSIICMLTAVLISFVRWHDGRNIISLSPTLTSCVYAVLLYSAYLVRFKGIRNMFQSWQDVIFSVLLILLFSSFTQAIMPSVEINFLIVHISISPKTLLLVSIAFSWLGMKLISLLFMFIIALIALGNLVSLDAAMGNLFGPIYVITSFIGLVSYMSTEPALHQGLSRFRNDVAYSSQILKSDLSYAKKAVMEKTPNLKIVNKDTK
ncbi:MAG: hypothetical protein IKX74_03725, partial [Erysipelotrichaceae bacterium]|nr:hypothetical protein [Erysipelotrichaceae bacterium]